MTAEPQPDALILCGGLGTRLSSVLGDRPKGLVEVAGRPFLDFLADELMREGLRRFVLCVGHGAAQIAAHFKERRDAEFLISAEDHPLGTGGAIAHAMSRTRSDPFFVVNGDSFCHVSYAGLLAAHRERAALLTAVVAPAAGRTDVGTIAVDETNRILRFSEKSGTTGDGLVNAGIYVMQREVVDMGHFATTFSLERELMPIAVRTGRCYAYAASGALIDIGTPERLRAAQHQLRRN